MGIGFHPAPKFRPGQVPVQMERRQKRRARMHAEDTAKHEARVRDGFRCRFPGCTAQREGYALHVAHLEDKGMGGDKRLTRTQRHTLMCLCWLHHEGPRSVHSKDIRIEPETTRGTDGACAFYVTDEQRKWRFVGVN